MLTAGDVVRAGRIVTDDPDRSGAIAPRSEPVQQVRWIVSLGWGKLVDRICQGRMRDRRVNADLRAAPWGAHYRHTTPEMAMRVIDAIDRRLTVVLGVAEQALEHYPNRSTPSEF